MSNPFYLWKKTHWNEGIVVLTGVFEAMQLFKFCGKRKKLEAEPWHGGCLPRSRVMIANDVYVLPKNPPNLLFAYFTAFSQWIWINIKNVLYIYIYIYLQYIYIYTQFIYIYIHWDWLGCMMYSTIPQHWRWIKWRSITVASEIAEPKDSREQFSQDGGEILRTKFDSWSCFGYKLQNSRLWKVNFSMNLLVV